MTNWDRTAPTAVSSRAEKRSCAVTRFSTTEDCWKNTIHGMMTAPMLAEASKRYLGSPIGIAIAPEATAPTPGSASTATKRNASSKAPTAMAMRSTVR